MGLGILATFLLIDLLFVLHCEHGAQRNRYK